MEYAYGPRFFGRRWEIGLCRCAHYGELTLEPGRNEQRIFITARSRWWFDWTKLSEPVAGDGLIKIAAISSKDHDGAGSRKPRHVPCHTAALAERWLLLDHRNALMGRCV